MRKLIVCCLFVSSVACARESRQRRWWRDFGQFHNCRVVAEREQEWVGRRGRLHEREETCYRCPDSPEAYCFAGPIEN